MLDDHWFDTLTTVLVGNAPRRTVLRVVAAVIAGIAHAGAPPIAAKNRNNKGNGKKKGKGKGRGKGRAQRCGQAACEAVFATQEDIDFCQIKCGRCKRAGTEFCIHGPDDEHPGTHATCCPRGQLCCGNECCAPSHTCCDMPTGPTCIRERVDCCPEDSLGWCLPGAICCPGVGCVVGDECPDPSCPNCRGPGRFCCAGACVNTLTDPDHCGGCNPLPCAGEGMRCCDGSCVDVRTDVNHCGACGRGVCLPQGWICCHGECADQRFGQEHCGGCDQPCIWPRMHCCDGVCLNTDFDPNNCGGCGHQRDGHLCCGGTLYDPDVMFCCSAGADGWPCFEGQNCCMTDEGLPACCNPDPE